MKLKPPCPLKYQMLLETCHETYLSLLKLPPNSPERISRQDILSLLRDTLAMAVDKTSEEIQKEYEFIIAELS